MGSRPRAYLLALVAAGCAALPDVRPSEDSEWFRREERCALDSGHPSERLARFLRREGLSEDAEGEADRLLEVLDRRLLDLGEREVALHLAELAYWRAERSPSPRGPSGPLHLASAEYAYAYLFDESLEPKASPFDASFRQACEYYNRSVAKLVATIRESGKRGVAEIRLPSLRRDVLVRRGKVEFQVGFEGFEDLEACYGYEVVNFEGAVRFLGLGAPLLATVPRPARAGAGATLVLEDFDRALPATAVLRFEGSIRDPGSGPRGATLDVLDTLSTTSVRIGSSDVALETDLTTPLIRTLGINPGYSGWRAMLDPEPFRRFSGLVPVQPFDPERIPLVFVHGFSSAPMAWLRLYQDLLADPAIRTRYQIWALRYPTGDPILVSASRFRAALAEARKTFDPEGKSRALRHMVVVGHSMGGLLASLQVRATGGRLWDRVTSTPFEALPIPEEDRAFLRPLFFFERNPDIRRVVFMATPHRGTEMAEGFFARLGASLVRVPGQTGSAGDGLRKALTADPGRHVPPRFLESMTGIDGLRPDNPFLGEIAGLPFPADVAAHSIVGNHEAAGAPGGTDGVVPYWSSHLEGARTEKIVKSEHDVQVRPETIGELRRILREHLAEYDAAGRH